MTAWPRGGFCESVGQGDVVQMGDPGCGDREGAAGAAVVAQNLVGLKTGEGVFDAGADCAVPGVVVLLHAGSSLPSRGLRYGMITPGLPR
jgi:hypothetical protein